MAGFGIWLQMLNLHLVIMRCNFSLTASRVLQIISLEFYEGLMQVQMPPIGRYQQAARWKQRMDWEGNWVMALRGG